MDEERLGWTARATNVSCSNKSSNFTVCSRVSVNILASGFRLGVLGWASGGVLSNLRRQRCREYRRLGHMRKMQCYSVQRAL